MTRRLSAAVAAALLGHTSYQRVERDGSVTTAEIAPMTVPVQKLTKRKPPVRRYVPKDPEIAAWNAEVDRRKGRLP